MKADICIIGGGLSGLIAAYQLQAQGKAVCVLEASNRLGGRLLTHIHPTAGVIELGGQFVSQDHNRLRQWTNALNIPLHPLYDQGKLLCQINGRGMPAYTLKGLQEAWDLFQAQWRCSQWIRKTNASHVPMNAFSIECDEHTVANKLSSITRTKFAFEFFKTLIETNTCVDIDTSSAYSLLRIMKSCGGLRAVLNAEGYTFTHGTESLIQALSKPLTQKIILNSPVFRIHYDQGTKYVESKTATVYCNEVIIALPPALANKIIYSPELPQPQAEYLKAAPPGSVIKFHCTYKTPFWREQGLSGAILTNQQLFNSTLDISPPGNTHGHLIGFITGKQAHHAASLTETETQAAIVAGLSECLGPQAKQVEHFASYNWQQSPYALGGFGHYTAPKAHLKHPHGFNSTHQGLYWIGADFAHEWINYMEGAIASAETTVETLLKAAT